MTSSKESVKINDELYPHGRAIFNYLQKSNEPVQTKHIMNGAGVPANAVYNFLAYLDGAQAINIIPDSSLKTHEKQYKFRLYSLKNNYN